MVYQVRSVGDGLHPVGPLSVANYALNPNMELSDPGQTANARTNLCTNPNFESGLTGWTTAGSVPPTITNVYSYAKLGARACQVTCNGSASFTNNLTYTASGLTIGTTYTYSAWVYVPSGFTGQVGCGIASGAFGSTASTSNTWSRISITYTATATSHAFIIFSNTYTTGQWFIVDAVLIEASSTLNDYFDGTYDRLISRTNLCTNPSFETGTASWSLGGSVHPTLTTSTTRKVFGTQSAFVTWPGSGILPCIQYNFSTTVGTTYTCSAYVYVPSGSPGVLLTVAGFSLAGQSTGLIKDDWARISFSFTATSTTSSLQLLATSSIVGTCWIDGVLIEQGTLALYFDGSLPPFNSTGVTQEWTGTAHASTSVQRVPVGTVAWNGTVNASTSTRWDLGCKDWVPVNATVTKVATYRASGLYSAKMVPNTTSLVPKITQTFTVFDLTNYAFSFQVFIPATITGGGLSVEFSPYDSTNTLIQLDTTNLLLTGAATPGFVRLATTYQTPAGTATLGVAIRPLNQPSSTSDVIYIDNVMFEQASAPSTTYVDGDTAGYVWAGTPGDSVTLKSEFPDALNFFGTYIWQKFTAPGSNVAMGGHATLHEAPWSPVPLTD